MREKLAIWWHQKVLHHPVSVHLTRRFVEYFDHREGHTWILRRDRSDGPAPTPEDVAADQKAGTA